MCSSPAAGGRIGSAPHREVERRRRPRRHARNRGEAGVREAALEVRTLHHARPHSGVPVVLDHEHDRPLIDGEVIGGEPLLRGVEGVFETVWTPEPRPIGSVHVAQGCQRFVRGERE